MGPDPGKKRWMWNMGGPGFGKQGLQTLPSLGLGLDWGQLIGSLMSLPGARPWLCLKFTPVSAIGTSK